MSACDPENVDGNVGLAFGLVAAAGFSTTIGGAAAFFMPYSKSSKNLFLAGSLSVAAGVMLYVSFIEIFATKAIEDFSSCVDERFAYLYATLCFFAGVAITYAFDLMLHQFEKLVLKRKGNNAHTHNPSNTKGKDASSNTLHASAFNSSESDEPNDGAVMPPPVTEGDTQVTDDPINIDENIGHDGHMVAEIYEQHDKDVRALIRMGIFAGIALGFHNFPEGLATFVAVLEDPSVGASVAIAIGIHNIPEGICVAMPIYYATGSRKKAVFWATLSGMTELVGAFFGWIVLRQIITKVVYGVLFGVVAGMMVYISVKELLPTAHRYDPDDKVTTMGLVAGMVVMAISLVLFQF